jgi:hypothetical protein
MRYTLYEHPVTHKFALVRLPFRFAADDKLPIPPTERWFENRAEAIAAVPDLLNREGEEPDAELDEEARTDNLPSP